MTARSDVLFITDKTKLFKSALGHWRKSNGALSSSAFTSTANMAAFASDGGKKGQSGHAPCHIGRGI
jgi:hypothetical protein